MAVPRALFHTCHGKHCRRSLSLAIGINLEERNISVNTPEMHTEAYIHLVSYLSIRMNRKALVEMHEVA